MLLWRFVVLLMKRAWGFLHGQQLVLPLLLVGVTVAWRYVTDQPSLEAAFRTNFWETVFPALAVSGICGIVLIVVAAHDLNIELANESRKNAVELVGPTELDTILLARTVSRTPGRVVGLLFTLFILALEVLAFRAAFPKSPLPIPPVAKYPPPELKTVTSLQRRTAPHVFAHHIPIAFSDSKLLTKARKERVDSGVNSFFEYLGNLGVRPLPEACPPLQITQYSALFGPSMGNRFANGACRYLLSVWMICNILSGPTLLLHLN